MRVVYLGTGAAEGIPALFCKCPYCEEARRCGEIRSRAQVLVDGELSVEFPPDAFYHSALLGADLSAVRYVLFTHAHMDHCYAHDFVLRGYKYAYNMAAPALDLYGNEETAEVFAESVRRELRADVADTLGMHTVKPFEKVCFGDWTVHPLAARHSSLQPLVYLIEKGSKRILHLTDTGRLPEETYEYLIRLGGAPYDLITLDCTFLWEETAPNARHMGLRENVRVVERLAAAGLVGEGTKKVITHFSHNAMPSKESLERAERQFGFLAAYDGMSLEL